MRIRLLPSIAWRLFLGAIAVTLLSGTMLAQGVPGTTLNDALLNFGPLDALTVSTGPLNPDTVGSSAVAASPVVANALPESPGRHKFWDNQNRALFATVAALSAADFFLTRDVLQNGGRELNPVTRLFSGSTAGLAANFAGETAGIIAVSYYFHKTGHHRLERIAPMLDIAASSFAVVYDLNHR
jgi:hypothetical protein